MKFTVLGLDLVFGRVFCGWICPWAPLPGTAALGRRLGLGGRSLPSGLDRPLRWVKYVILALITALAWSWGTLAWREFDPWVAVMHLPAGWSALEESPWSFAVLGGAVLGAGLFIDRFWCRYLCPGGGPFSRFSFWVRRSSRAASLRRLPPGVPVDLDPRAPTR